MKKSLKIIICIACALLATSIIVPAEAQTSKPVKVVKQTDTYQIVKDETVNGVRHITAIPSNMVCSQQIDFDLINGKIHNLVYIRGCNGNLKAIGRLLEGMTKEEAIKKLDGVDCGGRGTSCTDQLAQVLKALK